MTSNQNYELLLTFIQESHRKQKRHLDLTAGQFYSINSSGDPGESSVKVVSALGAFIACTTITLFIITIYMCWRVYKKDKKMIEEKKQKADKDKEEKYMGQGQPANVDQEKNPKDLKIK